MKNIPNHSLLKRAIENKECITADYDGYTRKLAPHLLGTDDGVERALCYQYGGKAKGGLSDDPGDNWLCVSIDELHNALINDDPFQTAEGPIRIKECINITEVEVEY